MVSAEDLSCPALSAQNYDEFSHFQGLVSELYVDIFIQPIGMNVCMCVYLYISMKPC